MLFTDSDIVTQGSLEQIDSEVPDVASAMKRKIRLEGPGSICEQAWRECGRAITVAHQLYSTYLAQPGMTSGHLSAVLNVGVPARTQPRVRLNQVVAHDWDYGSDLSAIQMWMRYSALALLYQDASARFDENDRYRIKLERWERRKQATWRDLRASGLPMVYQPMEAPGARHGFNPGSWSGANLTPVAASGAAGGNFVVAITWYDASKYTSPTNNGNAESGSSAILAATIPAGEALSVSIAGLNPPNGSADPVGTASGTWQPLNATHWNLYVGLKDSPLFLQEQGIPVATKSFSLSADPVMSGPTLGKGQWPDICICFQNTVMRG